MNFNNIEKDEEEKYNFSLSYILEDEKLEENFYKYSGVERHNPGN
jgi:hypothetical protein